MARYIDASCKLCRREKEKLFLKGKRCYTEKCAVDRRQYPPGEHGESTRRKSSVYGVQLREKQKVRRIYGLLEKQFRNYFYKAEKEKGITGENLLSMLECRLDNIVYRLGFAPSRKTARQLVLHGHFLVGSKKVNIPSYQVKPGQVVSVREKSRDLEIIHSALKDAAADLSWLRLDKARLEGELLEKPKRADIPLAVQEQLIVELYSK
ncbi:MAG: 30S ribosomal protein S4 [candidate division Zixibacteria bacterium]|nr:30S ribosomal protein S4 [candidate division Zixibacteria bacterium]